MLGEMMSAAHTRPATQSGFTLIEAMVVTAILAIALGLGLPSLRSWMTAQRVSAVATELATDMRYARSVAMSNNLYSGIVFKNAGNGCYTVYRTPDDLSVRRDACNCTLPAGTVCTPPAVEVKTVILPPGEDVSIALPGVIKEQYAAGSKLVDEGAGLDVNVSGGSSRQLKVVTTRGLHHPTICKPAGSTISGFKPCA